jgi:hypothetical protein
MAKYRINIALWQVPTLVVNIPKRPDQAVYERTLGNTIWDKSLDERLVLLEKRVRKAHEFFRVAPGPVERRRVAVFAAPEYLFARSASEHFITDSEKNALLVKLAALSATYPDVVLFPGTIAWKQPALRPTLPGSAPPADRGAKALAKRNSAPENYSRTDQDLFTQAQASGKQYFLARNTCYVMHDGTLVLKYHKRDNGNETSRQSDGKDVFFVHGAHDSTFRVKGLLFGLKICAEVATDLPKLVDVQVVISASRQVRNMPMQLRPGAYCCHADAIHEPTVWRENNGVNELVDPDKLLRGGGPLTGRQAGGRIAYALSFQDMPSLVPDSQPYAEKVTEMRGRTRYYRLDYDK